MCIYVWLSMPIWLVSPYYLVPSHHWYNSILLYDYWLIECRADKFKISRPRQMAAIHKRHFQMYFLEWKICELQTKFYWNLSLRFHLALWQHWIRWWLGAEQAPSHYLTNDDPVHWRLYVSPNLNELNQCANFGAPNGQSVIGIHNFNPPFLDLGQHCSQRNVIMKLRLNKQWIDGCQSIHH